jgi:hypothetical protein
VFLALDGNHHLIEVPFVGEGTFGCSPDPAGTGASELARPLGDGLEGDLDTAGGEHVLDMAKAQ